jgi:PAS domain S-box-containing protein
MGTWRYDLDTGKQKWDAMQREIFGIASSVEPTRELFRSMVHPEDIPKINLDLATLPIGTFIDSEFRITKPDGQVRWISASALARADASGRAVEMIGVNRDITDQKEAEAALKVSEETHRLAVAANDVGTWDYDIVTGEHRWSVQFRRLWGVPPDAPANPDLLRPLVDEREWATARKQWAAAIEGEGRFSVELRIRRADDNERRWCMFNGQIFFDEIQDTPVRAIGIMLDVTDRREAEEQQRLIVRELNHRVKNTLAVVQAIVSQTIRLTKKPSEAFDRIQERLMSVSRTHDFLSMSDWSGASLGELLHGELDPYSSGAGRVSLHGPFVRLHSTTALALGLVFHEMATNAAKYGSLSVDDGQLDVTWTVEGGGSRPEITITWREGGGPRVRGPRRQGFGSRLIEGSITGNLGGSLDLNFAPEGLRCVIRFTPRPLAETASTPDNRT